MNDFRTFAKSADFGFGDVDVWKPFIDKSVVELTEKLSMTVDIVLAVSSDSESRSLNSFSSEI